LFGSSPAGSYVTLRNTTAKPVTLIGSRSSACGVMTLHRTEHCGGQERMVTVKRISISGHGTFRFAPGTYRVARMKPNMHVGEMVPVTLRFAGVPP
jgi:copper(I)-binding protein